MGLGHTFPPVFGEGDPWWALRPLKQPGMPAETPAFRPRISLALPRLDCEYTVFMEIQDS